MWQRMQEFQEPPAGVTEKETRWSLFAVFFLHQNKNPEGASFFKEIVRLRFEIAK